MTRIGDWYDGEVGIACGVAFRHGFLCFLVGILKECCELDKKERRFIMWAAGVLKMASSLAITYSPDSAGHKLCSACCAVGLVLLIAGAVADNLAWMCGEGHRRGDGGEEVMGAGAMISIGSGTLKATIYLLEFVSQILW